MIIIQEAEDVSEWFVCFHATCKSKFWQTAIPGRFKHVRAFAYSSGVQCWVFYDVWLYGGTRITLAPAGPIGDRLVGQYIADAHVLKIARQPDSKPSLRSRLGFWCVPAIRHLVGLPGGALIPDALWRDCVRNGAQVIIDGRRTARA